MEGFYSFVGWNTLQYILNIFSEFKSNNGPFLSIKLFWTELGNIRQTYYSQKNIDKIHAMCKFKKS